MSKSTLKIFITVTVSNLIIGNGILWIGGLHSFTGEINYHLMAGLSIACVIIQYLFFLYLKFQNYRNTKLFIISVLWSSLIIFFGNSITLLISKPIKELSDNFPAFIVMGLMSVIIMFPLALVIGLLNFLIIIYCKNKFQKELFH